MILVVGSMNLDRIARLERAPAAGETVAIESLATAPGGKGGNVAAAAARLGARVAMAARVGQDADGDRLRAALAAAGVDVAAVAATPEVGTGSAWIWVEAGGENRIGVFAGANRTLTPAALDALAGGADSPFRTAALVVLNLEIPFATVERAIVLAHAAGARVVLNLSPVGALSPALLGPSDLLVVNGPEAGELLGQTPPADLASAASAAEALRRLGPGTAVVTLGAAGASAAAAGGPHRVAGIAVEAVDTTGAGDAFLGALAAGLDEGLELPRALVLAAAAGAFTATRPGAQSAQPTGAELLAFGRARRLSLPALTGRAGRPADGGAAAPEREG